MTICQERRTAVAQEIEETVGAIDRARMCSKPLDVPAETSRGEAVSHGAGEIPPMLR